MTAAPLDLLTATFLVCRGSAVIPFLNTEIYLLGSRRWLGRPLSLRWCFRRRRDRCSASRSCTSRAPVRCASSPIPEGAVPAFATSIAANPWGALEVVFLSAFLGLPPFYAVSLVAGGLGCSFLRFFVAGSCC